MARPRLEEKRSAIANVRLTNAERLEMATVATKLGHKSISEYVRHLHAAVAAVDKEPQSPSDFVALYPKKNVQSFHCTKLGEIFWGDGRSLLLHSVKKSSVDLIMTSPPFGLVRKKSYGNEDADQYCNWFRPFAEGFRRALKDEGSLVIDIGGSWVPGQPTRSLYHFKLLVMLVEEYGFHLCQEHYWWNPAKLPTPAEWVNVRRVRVKDAVNCIWWLSKTPFPKANNKRVLQPYSKSMQDLLKNGYVAKLRPSGHDISVKFSRDNGGAVPPNLLAVANTESTSRYQEYCRTRNIPIHPARFPAQIPEYFIRFLTEPGDLVVDPFGGSCVTGAVAEALGRKWMCCDLSEEYLQGALSRFTPSAQRLPNDRSVTYEIAIPCSRSVDEKVVPLFADGGAKRSQKFKTVRKRKGAAVPIRQVVRA